MSILPLDGIKVLDLSRVLAGPHCTMTLGDLGAHVIKVERPGLGDDTRGWGPPFAENGQSAYFLSTNRNKVSIAADFGDPDDRQLILDLMANADVVVENFLPGVLTRYGINADAILLANPSLFWCTISGFGPDSRRPGYDVIVQAECGWMSITGEPTGVPMKTGVALVDLLAGKDATIAILAALAGRNRCTTVQERQIHITLRDSALAALINVAQNTLVSGREPTRWGNAHANLVPYQLFTAADHPFVIAVGADGQWPAAARAVGLAELADDPSLSTNAGRLAQRDRVVAAIGASVAQQPAAVWMSALDAVGVPCGLVRSVPDALGDTAASAVTGVPPQGHGRIRFAPPLLDEHGAGIRVQQWGLFTELPILPPRPV